MAETVRPYEYPFAMPQDREAITQEPEPAGCHHDPRFDGIDWIGHAQQGGGHVPEDYEWPTSPKEHQEERGYGD
jgi:hypothetical protein